MIHLPLKIRSQLKEWYEKGEPFLFVVDYTGENGRLWKLSDVPSERVVYQIGEITNRKPVSLSVSLDVVCPISWERYHKAFERVQYYQRRGENYLLNLTFPTEVVLSRDLWEVTHAVRAPFVLGIRDEFLVFSPEMFVVIEGKKIATFPMKGTISADCEENLALLYDDPKEAAEHVAVVDLLRNDLGKVCRKVEVKRYRYWERVVHARGELYQTSSHIEGEIQPDIGIEEVFEAILPAGSVTGVPKPRACEIIAEVEGYERGWYTGVFGLFDGQRLVSAVMIRYLEKQKETLFYKSGGGIMVYSDARREYQELLEKVYVPVF
ncbi:aminodeoxychorismate synthase component I [Thermospira aquatica]|uniref:Aminodeoxychorismate synthase component I n=1 Tax=Thermospira aquatica TaxID=2828656 RepID=A0AAX3BBM6_9SPIR|nr:aminodeoxychorismate synthase component I [Thermospira aquatica]URA09655.1 aminodeoxychorismate synthase component I [Thermospira aquatica]